MSRSLSFSPECGSGFAYRRHKSQRSPSKSPSDEPQKLYLNACDQCHRRKVGCSRHKPACDRCQQAGRHCTYSLVRPSGRPRRVGLDQQPSLSRRSAGHDVRKSPSLNPSGSKVENTDYNIVELVNGSPRGIDVKEPEFDILMSPPLFQGHEDLLSRPASQQNESGFGFALSCSEGYVDLQYPTDEQSGDTVESIRNIDFEDVTLHQQGIHCGDIYSRTVRNDDSCLCLSDVVQLLGRKLVANGTRRKLNESLDALNEVTERLVHCDDNHNGLPFTILSTLYQEEEELISQYKKHLKDHVAIGNIRYENEMVEQSGFSLLRSPRLPSVDPEWATATAKSMLRATVLMSSLEMTLSLKFDRNVDIPTNVELMKNHVARVRQKYESCLLS